MTKLAFKIVDVQKVGGKTCVSGVVLSDFDMASVKQLLINGKYYDVLNFDKTVAVWGGVNVFYLIDHPNGDECLGEQVFVDEKYWYKDVELPCTIDNLTYFKSPK